MIKSENLHVPGTTHTSCKYDNHDNIKVNTKDVKFQ